MSKQSKGSDSLNWYDFWMQQSQTFFSSADEHLKDLFAKNTFVNPEMHTKQIQQWLDALKIQWQFAELTKEQQKFQEYWQMMAALYTEATEKMMEEWKSRTEDNNPITSTRELYELWLNACHEVYQKALKSKGYQDVYAEWMNATLKFWSKK